MSRISLKPIKELTIHGARSCFAIAAPNPPTEILARRFAIPYILFKLASLLIGVRDKNSSRVENIYFHSTYLHVIAIVYASSVCIIYNLIAVIFNFY